jgi:nucleotide-binding universal stress UspA family protein
MTDARREPPEPNRDAVEFAPDGGSETPDGESESPEGTGSESPEGTESADAEGLTVVLAVSGADVDRSPALADAVADLAGPLLERIYVVNAFSPADFQSTLERLNFDPDAPPEPTTVARRTSAVRDVTDRLDAAPGAPRVEIRGLVADDVGAAIVAVADEVGADRVFVGGRKRSPAGKAVFGSTAQHVLLNADAPVTFVRD